MTKARRLLLAAFALLLLAVAPTADAMSNAQRIMLLGSTPGWLLPGIAGNPGAVDLSFYTGQYYAVGQGNLSIGTQIVDSRASNETCPWSDGHVTYAAPNAMCITDLGLASWEARTNLAPNNTIVGGTGWTLNNAPTYTANALAPDGTLTAAQFVVTTVATTGAFLGSGVAPTLSASTTYTSSGWFQWVNGSTTAQFTVANQNAFGGTGGDRSVTFSMQTGAFLGKSAEVSAFSVTLYPNGWIWVTGTFTTTTITSASSIAFYAGGSPAIGSTFRAWGSQIEPGSFATPTIPTGGTAVSRASDEISAVLGSALDAALRATPGSAFVQTNGFNYEGLSSRLYNIASASSWALTTNGTNGAQVNVAGVALMTASLNSGTSAARMKTTSTYSGAATKLGVGNAAGGAGTVSSAADTRSTISSGTIYLGDSGTGTRELNGFIERLSAAPNSPILFPVTP